MEHSAWKLFDRVAADYDQVAPFFAEFGRAIVDVLDPPAGCRLLDLGCGRGALTAPALARGCAVTAVDASPAMVEHLTADFPAAAAYVMDAQALDLPSESFDLVVSSFVVHVLDDPAAGVAEAYRVLAPGGRFAFTGGSARTSCDGRGVRPDADPFPLGRRLDALFQEFAVHLPPNGSMGRQVDAADLLEEAGFGDLREEQAEVRIEIADNAMLWRWAMSHGYRAFIEDLPPDHRTEFHRRMLELPADDRVLRRVTGVWSGRRPR